MWQCFCQCIKMWEEIFNEKNLSKQKDVVHEKGDAAVVKVVDSQMDLYEVKTGNKASVDDLVDIGYITKEQAKTYNEAKK